MKIHDPVCLIHLMVTCALVGLIWIVQLVIYPQFLNVGREDFPKYHAEHMSRISFVVGPLLLMEGVTALWLFFVSEIRVPWFLVSLVFLLVNLLSTALIQVPQHKRLEADGYDEIVCRRLVAWNWLRTGAWTARACLVALAFVT